MRVSAANGPFARASSFSLLDLLFAEQHHQWML
jgi:hypothetical protein